MFLKCDKISTQSDEILQIDKNSSNFDVTTTILFPHSVHLYSKWRADACSIFNVWKKYRSGKIIRYMLDWNNSSESVSTFFGYAMRQSLINANTQMSLIFNVLVVVPIFGLRNQLIDRPELVCMAQCNSTSFELSKFRYAYFVCLLFLCKTLKTINGNLFWQFVFVRLSQWNNRTLG